MEGAQVPEDATMAARLREELAPLAAGRRVETVNAGVAGFGTGQELAVPGTRGARPTSRT